MIPKFRYWDPFNAVMTYSDNFKNLALFFENYQLAVDGENSPVLEQFSGFKDKSGNELFDGDTAYDSRYKETFEIHYNKDLGCWFFGDVLLHESAVEIEKNGNKLENPELLT